MLYIVATPIGNLKDITLRAIETLKQVDIVICEDTRRTSILLNHLDIKKPMIVLNDFNEPKALPQIIDNLKNGKQIALVSDAGTPLIADPGFKLVRECIKEKIPVDSIPGPSSVITALTLSGLPTDRFAFLGYFPEKPGKRQKMYKEISLISQITPITFVFFASPYKILKPLQEIQDSLGDIDITITSELTKIHQSSLTKKISQHLLDFQKKPPKGEYTLLFRLDN